VQRTSARFQAQRGKSAEEGYNEAKEEDDEETTIEKYESEDRPLSVSRVIGGTVKTFRGAASEHEDGRVLEMVFRVYHGNHPQNDKRAILSPDRDDWIEAVDSELS